MSGYRTICSGYGTLLPGHRLLSAAHVLACSLQKEALVLAHTHTESTAKPKKTFLPVFSSNFFSVPFNPQKSACRGSKSGQDVSNVYLPLIIVKDMSQEDTMNIGRGSHTDVFIATGHPDRHQHLCNVPNQTT